MCSTTDTSATNMSLTKCVNCGRMIAPKHQCDECGGALCQTCYDFSMAYASFRTCTTTMPGSMHLCAKCRERLNAVSITPNKFIG